MSTLARRPNNRKKLKNMGGKELVNREENHQTRMPGIMDHRPKK